MSDSRQRGCHQFGRPIAASNGATAPKSFGATRRGLPQGRSAPAIYEEPVVKRGLQRMFFPVVDIPLAVGLGRCVPSPDRGAWRLPVEHSLSPRWRKGLSGWPPLGLVFSSSSWGFRAAADKTEKTLNHLFRIDRPGARHANSLEPLERRRFNAGHASHLGGSSSVVKCERDAAIHPDESRRKGAVGSWRGPGSSRVALSNFTAWQFGSSTCYGLGIRR
jgi:hypothetical protein